MYRYIFLVLLFLGCKAEKKSDCAVPSPEAIFMKDTDQVESHEFKSNGRNAEEHIKFKNGVLLNILQGGCDQIQQEFSFTVPNTLIKEIPHTRQAINQLKFIAGLDIKLGAFEQWAEAIKQNEKQFFDSPEVEVAPRIFIKIDSIKKPDHTMILLNLRGA